MRLAPGVYYRKYGQRVYLRDTRSRRDYLMNAGAFPVLERLARGAFPAGDSPEERAFAEQLAAEGLTEGPQGPEEEDPAILIDVMEDCAARRQLYSVALELTYRCNERCIHCYVDDGGAADGREELGLEEYRALLDELRELGCMDLLLTGGEVCLKPEFLDIAAYAVSLGMLVNIYTNGYALTDEQFDALCALHLNSLSFSLYGGTAPVHDRITGVPGSFERTLRAAMMTKCAGIDTYIKTVVMRENADQLEELFRLGKRLHIPVTASYAIVDTHLGRSRAEHRLMDPERYRAVMEAEERFRPARARPGGRRRADTPVCSAGQCSLSVNPYGEVYPCLSLPISLGNLRQRSIGAIWRDSPPLERVRSLTFRDVCPGCEGCRYFHHCAVCLGATGILEGHPEALPPDACLIAQAYYQSARGGSGPQERKEYET